MIGLSLEAQLIQSGKLTQDQVEQIREMFSLVDVDHSGTLTYDELAKLMSQLSNNTITQDEAIKLIEKIDKNRDSIIEWEEFLQAMYEWLESTGALKDGSLSGNSTLFNERKIFHFNLANFFLQFSHDKNFVGFESLLSDGNENLEDRPDSWDFFGTKLYYNQQEKWQYYQDNLALLENFSNIAQRINSSDYNVVLSAVQDIVKLLTIVAIFKTPGERFEIANHIIRIFDLIENSSCLNRICEFLKQSEEPFLIWECLKVICLYCNGPRLANTPESSNLHPSKMYHKAQIAQKEIVNNIYGFATSQCIEVKRQAILAMGFLARNCVDFRDLFVSLGAAATLIGMVDDRLEVEDGRAISWTLSIFSGVTIKNATSLSIELILDLVKVFTFFLFWKDDVDCITNSLLGLSNLLPAVELKMENQEVWIRVIMMLTHNAIVVKRAAMYCIKKIISYNDLQLQFLIENKLIAMLSELLNYNNIEIKSEACDIISVLASKGYAWPILDSTSTIANLIRMIYEDSELRWGAVKVFKELSCLAGEYNKLLLNAGVMKTLFSNLSNFKDYDKVLKQIYGFMDQSYNFGFFIDSIVTLNNLVTTTEGLTNLNDFLNVVAQLLEQSNFDKLKGALDMFFNDIEQKRIPYVQLKKDHENIIKCVSNFLENCLIVFKNITLTDYSQRMIEYIIAITSDFEQKALKLRQYIDSYALYTTTNVIEVQCFSSENFPNGDNRTIQNVPINISLLELLLCVEHKYARSPITLHYVDNYNEQIMIDNDVTLGKAIEKAVADHQKSGAIGPVKLNLVVVSPMAKALRNYISSEDKHHNIFGDKIYDIFQNSHTNLTEKNSLLEDLNKRTNLSKYELEKIYNSFVNVTSRRFQNKNDGTVDFQEFCMIMKPFINDQETIQELFNSIDIEKTGKIDFRDFVCAISILKGGSLEDKLRLAFMAYDIDHNGFIDKTEMYQLLKTTAKSKGILSSDTELWAAVEKVFSIVDRNGDGCLSYTEFKEAVLNNHIFINSFWTDSKLMSALSSNNNTLSNSFSNRINLGLW